MSDTTALFCLSASLTTFSVWALVFAANTLRRAKYYRDEADAIMRRIEATLRQVEVRR